MLALICRDGEGGMGMTEAISLQGGDQDCYDDKL